MSRSACRVFVAVIVLISPLLFIGGRAGAQEAKPGVHRTPDERFANLDGFPFEPHYIEIDGLRMH